MFKEKRKKIELIIEERRGIERVKEPVTSGIPFPRGLLTDKNCLSLVGDGAPIPLQTEILSAWPDKSIKWLLLDFMANCPAYFTKNYYLDITTERATRHNVNSVIEIEDSSSSLIIKTGKAIFSVDKIIFAPFKSVIIDGNELVDSHNSRVILEDEARKEFLPVVKKIVIETRGPVRCTIKIDGRFESGGRVFCDFLSRLSFYANMDVVKIDFTIRNPEAAKHPGGLWDLGDPGSIFFKDLSIYVSLKSTSKTDIMWKTQINHSINSTDSNNLIIYQDSSGGEKWDSPSHVNRFGKVMNSFRGFRVRSNDMIEEGHRATPAITIASEGKAISASIQNFWQNFPKSIEAEDNMLKLSLFPGQYKDIFELQGGEQKTHILFYQFEFTANKPINLDWIQEPLIARVDPEWYAKSRAIGYVTPVRNDENPGYQKLVDNVIKGGNTFFDLREKTDEYGWRNFGDVYAEHETAGYKGSHFPFISHYNNQYDIINGCILQFARTGDMRWYKLMNDLARHVIDIDIYHTSQDRPAFNGGIFWHTDHFMHAETSSHRAFSKKNMKISGIKYYGGGLSPEHCYTTGLCMYYYLTGDNMAKESVIEIAEWIMNIDKLEKNILGVLRKVKRILSSLLNEYAYAPGRAQGNSIHTLLDAFELMEDRRYILKAERIIKKHISPDDDIDKLNQQQIELRWFYLIFLQSLGKYLEIKESINERDMMFDYARHSLLHHAEWMLDNEVPYKEMFNKVEIPSATWSAHDIRKSVIFDYAYKYADGYLKNAFKEKAEYFFNKSIEDVLSFDDESMIFVRPLAILMHYGVMHQL